MVKWFKNSKIGVKITLGFLLVAMIAGAIGAIGIASLNQVGGSYAVAYADTVTALESVERISTSFERIRTDLLEMTLASTKAEKEACVEALTTHRASVDEALAEYKTMLENYDAQEAEQEFKLIASLETAIDEFAEQRNIFVSGIAMDKASQEKAYSMLADGGELGVLAQNMEDAVTNLMNYNQDYAAQQIQTNAGLMASSSVIMVTGVAIGVLLAVLIGLFTSRYIAKPIAHLVKAADKLAQGDLNIAISVNSKDEVGTLAQAFQNMAATLKTIIADLTYGLEAFADGNFAIKSQAQESYVGDYLPLMSSLHKMRDTLSNTLRQINAAAEQVATGSGQVSIGAQALATGSTEQSASVEELYASVERIAEQATENTATVTAASTSIQKASVGINAGNEHMGQLTQAMDEIDVASNKIANISKVIEDIAFQTNILSLNAAIEAARAGDAGKGFAVVADEVRNLAAKSAQAAKQTGELIQSSVATVAKGTEVTSQTAQLLKDVGASTVEVTDSFGRIEQSIAEQTAAIEQIQQALSQISTVVQSNAATAEENSATSEEMSAQAATLRGEVGKFRLAAGTVWNAAGE